MRIFLAKWRSAASRFECETRMARRLRGVILGLLCASITACETALPEPDSEGARLYRQRCSGCHRLYQPGLLTPEMWQFMLVRMEQEFLRLGRPPLSETERRTILDYLNAHAQRPTG